MQILLFGALNLIFYFVIVAGIAFLCRILLPIPQEVFRKALHFILLGSFLVLIVSFPTWKMTAIAAIIFEVLVYPILIFFERFRTYSDFTTERKKGELKSSLMLVYTMFAIVVAICWGIFSDKWLAIASLYAWGIGDAFAALIGKKYGKHKIHWPGLDGKKSYEGSLSMYLLSAITVFTVLTLRGGLALWKCISIALIVAAASAISELYSRNGNDTVICPLASMAVLLPLVYLLGGIS